MKVSVLIITYNQEEVVGQALNSVLMQKVSFPYEIVVGEDVSTDRTRDVVLEFQKKYPDKIRVMLRDPATSERDRSLGLGGKTNFMQGLQDCRGEYVALLDGDDYWIDAHKLQKQVDFLDRNPDFAISYHNTMMFYEDGSKPPAILLPPDHREVSTIEDLLIDNDIPTCSVVFRRGLFGALPDWFFDLRVGDWPIHIMNAQHGKIGYMNEVMSAYRQHLDGYWSRQVYVERLLEIVKFYEAIKLHLGPRYKRTIDERVSDWYYKLALNYANSHNLGEAERYILKSIFRRPVNKYVSLRQRSATLLSLYHRHFYVMLQKNQRLYNLMRKLKRFFLRTSKSEQTGNQGRSLGS